MSGPLQPPAPPSPPSAPKPPRMSAQQRVGFAKHLRRRAASQPGLKAKQRQELRRVSTNLLALNTLEALHPPKSPKV
jgi:hypothetical protein